MLGLHALRLDPAQYTVAMVPLALAGAAAGFLIFNFPPAKVFMGDSGAELLGYVLGISAIIGGAKISQDTATGSIAIIPAPTQAVPNPVATVISSAGGVSTVQTTAGKVTAAQINAVVTQAEQIAANNVNASSSTFGNVNTSGDVLIGGNLTVTGNIVAPNAMVYRGADQLSWDSITLMGTYLVNRNSWAGTTGTPLNSQVFTGTLEVNASGTSITQNYRPYDGSANPRVFWTRSQFNAGSWSGWVELTNNAEITDGGRF